MTTAYTTPKGGYGRWVVIDHGNGESSLYAHLASVVVAVGQRVDQGAMIGTLGDSGNASGAHLHFEEKSGRSVVPAWFAGIEFRNAASTSKNCVDVPLAGDFAGDGAAEVAVFRCSGTGTGTASSTSGSAPRGGACSSSGRRPTS